MQPNYDAEKQKFVEWLATPKKLRKPITQAALSKELGVTEETLSHWKKTDGFMKRVYAAARGQIDNAINDIYASLIKEATGGGRNSVQAIKLALEVIGEYVARTDMTSDGEKLAAPTMIVNIPPMGKDQVDSESSTE